MPDKAPAFYFVDIQAQDAERFDAFIKERAPGARLERVPMLRGRIVAANGIKAEDLKPAAEHRLGAAERPRHHPHRPRFRKARGWWKGNGGAPIIKARR